MHLPGRPTMCGGRIGDHWQCVFDGSDVICALGFVLVAKTT